MVLGLCSVVWLQTRVDSPVLVNARENKFLQLSTG